MRIYEVYSGQRLDALAEALAKTQEVRRKPVAGRPLKGRVVKCRRLLAQVYEQIEADIDQKRLIPPAAEWIVDNFHVIQAQVQTLQVHLSSRSYKNLPKLEGRALKGLPRIYGVLRLFAEHTDCQLEPDLLFSYLKNYQKEQPLEMSELWALSMILGTIYLENLAEIGTYLQESLRAKARANALADEILGLGEKAPRSVETILAVLDKETRSPGFLVYLLQRLRFQEARMDLLTTWVERQVARQKSDVESLVSHDQALQVAANTRARNIINSFRLMVSFDWQEFFEKVSLVDMTLRQNAMYGNMDFITRDRYRHRVESLSARSRLSELEVARKIISITSEERRKQFRDLSQDPGYYLIGQGRREFEKLIGYHRPLVENLKWHYRGLGRFTYPMGNLLLTALLTWLFVKFSEGPSWALAGLGVFIFLVLSDIQTSVVHRVLVALLGPQHLPRYNLEAGIPEDCATMIVVPTMLTKMQSVEAQVGELEIHYLTNPGGYVYFALLTDVADAATETLPTDHFLEQEARHQIALLNQRHGPAPDGKERFHLLHRRRLWNEKQNRWMGWERKRGKLHELNVLLLRKEAGTFLLNENEIENLPGNIRFVLTLDADTKLPRGNVGEMVGTLAHPLNRAVYDEKKGRVVQGYSILQPRITPALPATEESSWFQKLTSGPCGVDPYASAVSDVYQDVFGEGSFAGKGLYDLHMFDRALGDKVPENALLSHDLFEGNIAGCAFLNDLEFFEEFPSHVLVAGVRQHRWMRGDWQLLPWLLGRGGRAISVIGRWKMLDNLRRSLVPVALFVLWVTALALNDTWFWWLLGLALLGLCHNELVGSASDILLRSSLRWRDRLRLAAENLAVGSLRWGMNLLLLPYNAFLSIDAILRTLFRMTVSHRNLLEWVPAAQVKDLAELKVTSFWRGMSGALILTLLAMVFWVWMPGSSWLGFVVGAVWLLSPFVAYSLSLPPKPKIAHPLHPEQNAILRQTARKTWHFFATFVTAEDRHLPPDNFQEDPEPVIAHRSSPTNFGLYLLSALAAKDFSWLGVRELAERWWQTLTAMDTLAKHEGHFLNWYETTTGRPLEPRYVSSVDNGNLAGHLIVVAQAAEELADARFKFTLRREGLNDTLRAILEIYENHENSLELSVRKRLQDIQGALLRKGPADGYFWNDLLKLTKLYLDEVLRFYSAVPAAREQSLCRWSLELYQQVLMAEKDYHDLLAWKDHVRRGWPEALSMQAEEAWGYLTLKLLDEMSLRQLADFQKTLGAEVRAFAKTYPEVQQRTQQAFYESLLQEMEKARQAAQEILERLQACSRLCQKFVFQMDFGLLYDNSRKLFSIGLRVAEGVLDNSYYDLLASEARLLSFVAIAKGDVPALHWFRLGRGLVRVRRGAALVSWSGSMFEYLMPSLVLRTPEGSIHKQTCELSVWRQMDYAKDKGVPWGMSESAYNKRDLHKTYQYSNFGVPELALKRGVENDVVVAPYATLMAAMYEPLKASQNLLDLKNLGAQGEYGFYESVDFTSTRLRENQTSQVIRAYMAHHQGMAMVALANVFHGDIMVKRFHAEPLIQATELLLQEREVRSSATLLDLPKKRPAPLVQEAVAHLPRQYHRVQRATPPTQILSNGEYTVMMTIAGSGYSRYGDKAVSRWREDVTQDQWGQYFFIRDVKNGSLWSATYLPLPGEPEVYEVDFAEDRVRYLREDNEIQTELEVLVAPDAPMELRRIYLTNKSDVERELDVTSYFEAVLNSQGADQAHPAFSNLFVQTEYLEPLRTLVASRRARSSHERPLWLGHGVVLDDYAVGDVDYETDRAHFLGRGRSLPEARALERSERLGRGTGPVLDPVMSLRARVVLPAGVKASLTFYTQMGPSREAVVEMADHMQDRFFYERLDSLAWTQAQIRLHYLNIEPDEAHLFQRLATRLIFLDASLRPSEEVLKSNRRDLGGLWALGVSGDHPIMLVRIEGPEELGLVRQLLKAQGFFAAKNFKVDLVVMNEQAASYAQELQQNIDTLIQGAFVSPSRGGAFSFQAARLSEEEKIQLFSEARVVLSGRLGSLSDQLSRVLYTPPMEKMEVQQARSALGKRLPALGDLQLFNGVGGFLDGGREYVIDGPTPAPWLNVISNGNFGFQVSESGAGYTWAGNSRENQLTPWSNDPISDPSGEMFYLYDHERECLWSPTLHPLPAGNTHYRTRHGQGYTLFEHEFDGLESELLQFVPLQHAVKISRLRLYNGRRSVRSLSLSAYVEWVLGFVRSTMAPSTVTVWDDEAEVILAMNTRNPEFGQRVAFAGFLKKSCSFSGDRREFIGRNGTVKKPRGAWGSQPLSDTVGAGYDPCAAFKLDLELAPQTTEEIYFVLGQVDSVEEARALVQELVRADKAALWEEVKNFWEETLGRIQVQTPEPAFDLMMNRWLMYQTLSCRFWARAAFYQAGGAYGFRDQLQDSMALMWTQPDLAREHILRAASRQFIEGDVQHWWHPPSGRGVRTHFSDDLLWLPYVVSCYLNMTEDDSILEERVRFLEGPLLAPEQEDSYFTPQISIMAESVYEHCARALDRSLRTGEHGLPLIGCGDWNDGMNRIGQEGRGESVWLAWFLIPNLRNFAALAQKRGEKSRATKWLAHIEALKEALEAQAWDGEWYRRAFYDDGTPVGSKHSDECQIDSLAQTWAVISGAASPARAQVAMKSLQDRLIQEQDKLVLLFAPPFDRTSHDPGYIKGYLPGVRENGGQYTHAATWCVIALAMLGQGDAALQTFNIINPLNHSRRPEEALRYKAEPYVLAGDVYSQPPHTGRGGWSWYTGASGWFYRAGLEYILGLRVQGNKLSLQPCVAKEWKSYRLKYQFTKTTSYEFVVSNPDGVSVGIQSLRMDGEPVQFPVEMKDDGRAHRVEVTLGTSPSPELRSVPGTSAVIGRVRPE